MNNTQLRISIAEALGAKWHWIADRSGTFLTFKEWDGEVVKPYEPHTRSFIGCDVPDYPNDLNACHDMESALTEEQWKTYCVPLGGRNTYWSGAKKMLHATPLQKCEAFLKAVNL